MLSIVDQPLTDVFFRSGGDVVHALRPADGIGRFQCFCNALCGLHLGNQSFHYQFQIRDEIVPGADVSDIHEHFSFATFIVTKASLLVEWTVKQKNPGLPEMVTRDKTYSDKDLASEIFPLRGS